MQTPKQIGTPVYGLIAICDFLTNLHNQDKPRNGHAIRAGQNLNFDDYVQKLNYSFKTVAEQSAIHKNTEVKDKVKAFTKSLEDTGFIADLIEKGKYGTFSMLHAMFYCFLEPVSKLLNQKMQ